MIFVDTNVFMYAVGRDHPLRQAAQDFFIQSRKERKTLVSSAEVAQELLHAYLPASRIETLDAALDLFSFGMDRILDITIDDVRHDIIVEDTIILELKSVRRIIQAHEVQMVNYLVATGKPVGLVINFGERKVEIKRKVRDFDEDLQDEF